MTFSQGPKEKTFLIVSIAAHALLAALLYHWPKMTGGREALSTHDESIEFSVVEEPKSTGKAPVEHGRAKDKHSVKSLTSHFSYSDISTGAGPSVDVDTWGSGAGEFALIENSSLYNRVYTKIDSILSYPSSLAQQNIQGDIQARLQFDPLGNCSRQGTQVFQGQDQLRLYVLHVLAESCKERFPRPLSEKREHKIVDLAFHFSILETTDKLWEENNSFIVGNSLNFARSSAHSKLQWNVGPFAGMFPLPFVALDLTWFYRKWTEPDSARSKPAEISKDAFTPRGPGYDPSSRTN